MKIKPDDYKNIIFDLGGVLLNIDYNLTVKAFKNLGINNFDELFSQASQFKLFDKYDKGLISSSEFRNEINKLCDKNLSNEQIDNAWNAILLDFPKERLELLNKVKQNHKTFLLSNTTEIHITAFKKYMKTDFGINDFFSLFHKSYLSYEIGMRKPDAEIFELVLQENNLISSETLYIDDSIQHVEAALKLGIKAYWLDIKKESVIDLFI